MKTFFYSLLLIPFLINAQKPKLIGNFNLDTENGFKATKINDKVVFKAFTNTYGEELWVTDGTSANTMLLKDFVVGPGDSFFNRNFIWNGELYFTAYSNTLGDELWKTDGTPSGTVLVADIVAGTSGSQISSFASIGPNLYFLADDNNYLRTLYKYDGTAVSIVHQNANQARYSGKLLSVDGTLYFEVSEFNLNYELWKSDGTAVGTSLVKSFPNYRIEEIGKNNNEVFFTLDGATKEVWKSNGTPAGTVFLTHINQAYGNFTEYFQESNSLLYFSDNNKVFKYDNGILSTIYVGSNIKYFKCTNSEVLFVDEVVLNQKLYIINGINTPLVLKEFQNGSQDDDVIFLAKTSNGTIYISIENETYGHELWKSDGTPLGTILVKDIVPNNLGSLPKELIAVNNQIIFFAKTILDGYEPWISDGTGAGTIQIKNVQQGVLNATPRRFITNGNNVHFSADRSISSANAQFYNGIYISTTNINQSTEKVL